MDFQETRAWRLFIVFTVLCLLALILVEWFFMEALSPYFTIEMLEFLTLIFTFVLMLDIYVSFLKAKDKKKFLKNNMLKILIILPWGTFFRALSVLRLERAFAEVPLIADILAMEKLGAAASSGAYIAKKAKRISEL